MHEGGGVDVGMRRCRCVHEGGGVDVCTRGDIFVLERMSPYEYCTSHVTCDTNAMCH